MAAAAEAGIITGRESGGFAPFDTATRAEAAEVLSRTLKYIKFGEVF